MIARISRRSAILVFVFFVSLLSIFFVHQKTRSPLLHTSTQSVFPPHPQECRSTTDDPLDLCSNFPKHRLRDVQVVFKTGIGERDKARVALKTFASCISNLLIVSDAEDTLAGHHVRDVLADLPSVYAVDNPDWEVYEAQRRRVEAGEKIEKSSEGWRLDRLKFLPMVELAYQQAPNAKWYVFIETDIYIFWDPLFRLLDTLDPNHKHFLGSAIAGAYDVWFPYGGAGFVLSHQLMETLVGNGKESLSLRHAQLAKDDCCGDAILGYAIYRDLGVRVGSLYPAMSGDELSSLLISPGKWCTPLVTLHRADPALMTDLWHWERCHASTQQTITYSDVAQHRLPIITGAEGTALLWDNNGDEGRLVQEIKSAPDCFSACRSDDRCFQTLYKNDECYHADFLKLGHSVKEPSYSSWNLTRFGLSVAGTDTASQCTTVNWPKPSVWLPPSNSFLARLGLQEMYYELTT